MQGSTIYYSSQDFAGWPANAGMWNWGNEVLVAFHVGRFQPRRSGHDIDAQHGVRTALARSLDGGKSWRLEMNSNIHEISLAPPIPLPEEGIDFAHPDFALKVGRAAVGISNYTYLITYDRGRTWQGPYLLPEGNRRMSARTSYLIEGRNSCILFLSRRMPGIPCKSHPDRSYAVRTDDGGKTWEFLGYMADRSARSVLANAVRMSDGSLICSISRRHDPHDTSPDPKAKHSNHWIEIRRSIDGGRHWRTLSTIDTPYPPRFMLTNPSCLGHLPDGRLVIHYAFRGKDPRFVARISQDGGRHWGEEIILDNDVLNSDVGYPKLAMLPFGTVLVVYHSASADKPQQHIKCILWQP